MHLPSPPMEFLQQLKLQEIIGGEGTGVRGQSVFGANESRESALTNSCHLMRACAHAQPVLVLAEYT